MYRGEPMFKKTLIVATLIGMTLPGMARGAGSFSLGTVVVSSCGASSVNLTTTDPGGGLGFDFDVTYDASKVTVTGVTLGPVLTGDPPNCLFATNFATPGTIAISIACEVAPAGTGTVATIEFDPVANGTSPLNFAACEVDEEPCTAGNSGQISVTCFPTPSPTPTSAIPCTCPGDANKNNFVNFADYGSVQANFGAPANPATGAGDANCNGFVNFADYGSVAANFGLACPTRTPTPVP